MKDFFNKYKIIIYVVLVLLIALGIYLWFRNSEYFNTKESINTVYVKNTIEDNTNTDENELKRTIPIENGDKNLEKRVKQDEDGYGENYQKFTNCEMTYKRRPDRIYFKKLNERNFYVFEKEEINYNHLVEVAEDRMAYASMEDFNLYAFTPLSINSISTSNNIYIIFDYDNGNLSEFDKDYCKDIIFTFNENTRLYRLLSYLSSNKKSVSKDNLPKKEFATDTNISGYKYMMYNIMD